jgi:hypothetical protein
MSCAWGRGCIIMANTTRLMRPEWAKVMLRLGCSRASRALGLENRAHALRRRRYHATAEIGMVRLLPS